MTILHVIDFIALSFVVVALCEELRVINGRRNPVIAILWVVLATLAFLCASYDLAGAPLHIAGVVVDSLCAWAVWKWFRA